ncbi:MAG TPA: tRNA (adenosine(37)-N6)-dimethylallyltransferase MiaA [Patescibacteria group bacterium]|nr:tRNA (adenosine(37)-N6)-dimethylallyltransferase MiaA [Patescibacteria group bacterium]
MKKLLIISGQTATGKTALGIQLAQKLNGEIVSFDSRQAYRYLDVITGKEVDKLKIKNEKLKVAQKNIKFTTYLKDDIPIWLYDMIDPQEYLNAYEFCQIAEEVIDDIIHRGKLPIIVGGSVFYIKVLLEGLGSYGVAPDWKRRKDLEKKTIEELQKQLLLVNKKRLLGMNHSDRNNKRRLIRAIEIGASIHRQHSKKRNRYTVILCALSLDKSTLKEVIQKRVLMRLSQGALEEIQNLLKKNYSFDNPGFQTIGYKQLRGYFNGQESLKEAIFQWVSAEVQYAKRQMVFLKKMENVFFMPADDKLLVEKIHELVYSSYNQKHDTEN